MIKLFAAVLVCIAAVGVTHAACPNGCVLDADRIEFVNWHASNAIPAAMPVMRSYESSVMCRAPTRRVLNFYWFEYHYSVWGEPELGFTYPATGQCVVVSDQLFSFYDRFEIPLLFDADYLWFTARNWKPESVPAGHFKNWCRPAPLNGVPLRPLLRFGRLTQTVWTALGIVDAGCEVYSASPSRDVPIHEPLSPATKIYQLNAATEFQVLAAWNKPRGSTPKWTEPNPTPIDSPSGLPILHQHVLYCISIGALVVGGYVYYRAQHRISARVRLDRLEPMIRWMLAIIVRVVALGVGSVLTGFVIVYGVMHVVSAEHCIALIASVSGYCTLRAFIFIMLAALRGDQQLRSVGVVILFAIWPLAGTAVLSVLLFAVACAGISEAGQAATEIGRLMEWLSGVRRAWRTASLQPQPQQPQRPIANWRRLRWLALCALHAIRNWTLPDTADLFGADARAASEAARVAADERRQKAEADASSAHALAASVSAAASAGHRAAMDALRSSQLEAEHQRTVRSAAVAFSANVQAAAKQAVEQARADSERARTETAELNRQLTELQRAANEQKLKSEAASAANAANAALAEDRLCSICLDTPKDALFQPCSHIACCMLCAEPLSTCPLCQQTVTARQKVFL